jgi:hypothetical protein
LWDIIIPEKINFERKIGCGRLKLISPVRNFDTAFLLRGGANLHAAGRTFCIAIFSFIFFIFNPLGEEIANKKGLTGVVSPES